jgi:hypothetical protein
MNWCHRFALDGYGISFVPNPLIFMNVDIATKTEQISACDSHLEIFFWKPRKVQTCKEIAAGAYEHYNVVMKVTAPYVAYM